MTKKSISSQKILLSYILLLLFTTVGSANFRMIDFPLTQTSVNADTYLSEENLANRIDVIWSYEDDGWRYWAPAGRTDITDLLTSYTRLSELRQGLGYLVKFNSNSANVSFANKTIYSNSVRLSSTNYSLASFNLDADISLESLFADENIAGGTKSDIEEVWQYDSTRKIWLFYSADASNSNFNSYEQLTTLSRGTSIWIKSKVAGLEIKLNNESPVILISGTSTLVPPAITNPSTSLGFGDFILQNTEVNGLCKFDGTDIDPIGTAALVTSNGEQLASTSVFCPSSGGQKVAYSLALTPTVINHLNEFPESGKNSVVRILLNSGQEQKSLIHSNLKTKIDNNETSVTADLDTTSSFVVAVAEMELAKRAGIAADQVNLGVSGNSNSGDVLDLSKVWGADDYPIDMLRFQELVNKMIGEESDNHIQQMFQTIEDLNDPAIDASVRQSVNQYFTTTPQDSTKRIQSLLSASMDLISANVEAEKNSVLSGTTNPVEICAQKLLEVDPSLLENDATDNLINACNLVEENVKLAVSVVGDPTAKQAALQNITELANNFDSETLSRIATSPTPFEFLNLTSRLVSFPKNLVDALGDNQSASAALAALLGQSAELLAQAKGIDAQAALQNNTRKAEILAAIKALEAENARLEKVFTISSDPDEIVKRMADYIANGGDPSKINEVSDLLEDSFADGTPIDYGKLIDEVRKTTHNPADIITDLIKSSSDKLLGMKVFAESAHLLSAEQLSRILNDRAIKDEFALDRNLIALAGRDKEIRVRDGSYTLSLNGSRSFDPKGDTNLRYTWQEIDQIRGNVISTLSENSVSPQVSQILSSPDGFKYYRLTVTNFDGSKSSEDELRIKFYRHPLPVVIFSPNYISVEPNNLVTASVADSYYPEGDTINSFSLEQISGPTADASLTGTELSFTPSVSGAYVFKVSATVNEATTDVVGSSLLTVRVRDQFPPEVDAGPDAQIKISTAHKLENFSFSPNEASLTYKWSPALFLDNTSIQEPTFTPQEDGEYEFTLTVTDEFGNSGEDKVRIEVVRSFPPIAVTTESVEVDFRALSTDVVAINLDGCRSFSIDDGLPITNYSWASTTYTSSIENSSSCSAEIKIYENNYTEPSTEHFFLTVGDGISTNEGTFSVHVLPSTSLPPQIILETFPEKTIYTAGEELILSRGNLSAITINPYFLAGHH